MKPRFSQLIPVCLLLLPLPGAGLRAETLLLTGASVHTASGETLSPGMVLIRDGWIEAVGPTIEAPDARVVPLDGLHLFPGMIAATTSMGLVEIAAVRATRDLSETGQYTPDVPSWIAVNPDSELIPVTRANGVSHVLPVPQGGRVSGQSGLVALDGWTTEEMTIRHPVALHVVWPSMSLDSRSRPELRDPSRWRSPEDQARSRRNEIRELQSFFDEARAYARAVEAASEHGTTPPRPHPAWDAMLPYVRGELPVMIRANDARQIRSAVEWSETNRVRIIIAGGRDAWRLTDLLAEKKVPVIFENVFTLPARDVDPFDVHFKAPFALWKAGVPFAISNGISGHDGAALVKNLPNTAAQAAAYGLPEIEALRAITLYPARMLGVSDRLGSIEPGREATLFAATGHILDIRARVTRMWIAGREVSLDDRHTRLYEKYRGRPRPE